MITRTLLLTALAAAFVVAPAQADIISYNGHAGLGGSVYQHNQSDLEFLFVGSTDARVAGITDGTSNTIVFGVRTATSMADMGGQFFS